MRPLLVLVLAGMVVLAGGGAARAGSSADSRVLVFSKTTGFRHSSIPAATTAVRELAAAAGFAVDTTEDSAAFTDANLGRYAVIVFLLTTGDVLDVGQQAAFKRYIEAGGGFVGVHSAADTEHDWPWYGRLVGAYFESHPAIQPAAVDVVDRHTPSTVHLPARWLRSDEWYNFASNPSGAVTVLATVDERTYAPGSGAMGSAHPIAWQHAYDGGRSWYTAGGHTDEAYSEPLFRSHLLGGLLWAAGFDLPRIDSLRARLAGRRLTVILDHPNCRRCTARIRVRVRGRLLTTRARADGARTRLTTRALPRGRWSYTVTLDDLRMATRVSARRSIEVG